MLQEVTMVQEWKFFIPAFQPLGCFFLVVILGIVHKVNYLAK